jgi:SRSO17 transposase
MAAHVPVKTGFATKPAVACAMIQRARSAQVPFTWVAADSIYGVRTIGTTLRRAGKTYVLGVSSGHSIKTWANRCALAEPQERLRKLCRHRTGRACRRAPQ